MDWKTKQLRFKFGLIVKIIKFAKLIKKTVNKNIYIINLRMFYIQDLIKNKNVILFISTNLLFKP